MQTHPKTVKSARKNTTRPATSPHDSDRYLDRLGERVRRLRNQRGMTRKALAQHAEVSERYLAQLESGEGNCSIVLLRRIAHAMGVQVPQLVSEMADPPLDVVLFNQFVERLPAPALKEARDMVMARFADLTMSSRRSRIALLGLRGGGKSTLGELLAKQRGVPFIELDREIERASATSLTEIFQLFGQETFRRAEREALDRVLAEHREFVMATSGSIVTEPGTLDVLLSSCFTIWVKAEPDVHMARVVAQGDLRPMSANPRAMDDLVSILNSREPLYAKADATLDTNGRNIEASLADLAALTAPQIGP
jgi:XRE family aerobic/anaerobic benzoate catabolism transcriptional regulator